MTFPVITVVICTRNREAFLRKCIASLQMQNVEEDCYEILVVDNGSTDSTVDVVREFQDDPRIRYVFEPIAGLSRARNTGWRNATGSFVGYIDDDAVVANTWVASALWVIENITPAPVWIGGPINLEWERPKPGWIDEELMIPLGYIDWGADPRVLGDKERLGGGNSIYDKAMLQQIEGFDERLGREKNNLLSGEETQLQKRVTNNNGTLYYHPGIKIYHWVGKERVNPGWFYRRYYWGGVSDYFMRKTLTDNNKKTDGAYQESQPGESRCLRLIVNLYNSLGVLSGKKETIHARIYLAYVFGYCAGIYRWRMQRAEN